MSLFGNLFIIYEMIQGVFGQIFYSVEKDGDVDVVKRVLILYGYMIFLVLLIVFVDVNGCIRGVVKRKSIIIIFCIEELMGRIIKLVLYLLFDQLQYVDSGCSFEKMSMYLQQFVKWKGDDVKFEVVFKCVLEYSISEVVVYYGVELMDKDDKVGVCFEV